MAGSHESDQPITDLRDCHETGMLVLLAGVKLDIHDSRVYDGAAAELGIFQGNIIDARVKALGQQLTAINSSTMRDQITDAGKKYLKAAYPKELRKLVSKIMLNQIAPEAEA